jgi:hypothetical protein
MASCSQCTSEATFVDKHRRFCNKHYRFNQMRQDSWTRHKVKHSVSELEDLLPVNMKCPRCKVDMIWRRSQSQKGIANQITIQHWNDGTIGFLCHRCNTQHGSMDDQSFQLMSLDHKYCPDCKNIKHESEFSLKSSRALLKRNSICNLCNGLKSKEWKSQNKDHINAYQRAYRAKRKAEGNPVKRKL